MNSIHAGAVQRRLLKLLETGSLSGARPDADPADVRIIAAMRRPGSAATKKRIQEELFTA